MPWYESGIKQLGLCVWGSCGCCDYSHQNGQKAVLGLLQNDANSLLLCIRSHFPAAVPQIAGMLALCEHLQMQ
jgi:hypothetical protein